MTTIKLLSDGLVASNIPSEKGDSILTLREGAAEKVSLDINDHIASGVTISALTSDTDNVSITAPTHAEGVISTVVTGPSSTGYFTLTAELSDSQIVIHRIRVRRAPEPRINDDYACGRG